MRRGARAERIDSALSSGAIGQRHGEGPGDVVAALGLASRDVPAGREVKHLRTALTDLKETRYRDALYRPAIRALELVMLTGRDTGWCAAINAVERFILIRVALTEWLSPWCRTCSGNGSKRVGIERFVCATCNGARYHRFSDAERETELGRPLAQDDARFLAAVHVEIGHHDMLATEGVARKLR